MDKDDIIKNSKFKDIDISNVQLRKSNEEGVSEDPTINPNEVTNQDISSRQFQSFDVPPTFEGVNVHQEAEQTDYINK